MTNYLDGLVNHEAEDAVLGGLFLGPDELTNIIGPPLSFKAEMFQSEQRQAIFAAMITLYRQGKPCDYLLLKELLDDRDADYLFSLIGSDKYWRAPHVAHYADLVKKQWRNRLTAQLAAGMVRDAHGDGVDWKVVQDTLADLRDDKAGRGMTGGEAIDSLNSQELVGHKTGYGLLDWMTYGFTPGHLWIIDGFTSTGKTMFALNLVYNMLKQGVSAAYFSMEASIEELALRTLGIRSGVSIQKIRWQQLDDEQQSRRAEADDWLASAPVRFYDNVYDVDAIDNEVRELQLAGQANVIVVDYLQSLRWDDLYIGMTRAVLSLQALAKDQRCTVIAVSQIGNDEARARKDADFYTQKGSGDIKDKADKILRIRRKRGESEMDIQVLKNRQGKAGDSFPLHLDLETGRISSAERTELQPLEL